MVWLFFGVLPGVFWFFFGGVKAKKNLGFLFLVENPKEPRFVMVFGRNQNQKPKKKNLGFFFQKKTGKTKNPPPKKTKKKQPNQQFSSEFWFFGFWSLGKLRRSPSQNRSDQKPNNQNSESFFLGGGGIFGFTRFFLVGKNQKKLGFFFVSGFGFNQKQKQPRFFFFWGGGLVENLKNT